MKVKFNMTVFHPFYQIGKSGCFLFFRLLYEVFLGDFIVCQDVFLHYYGPDSVLYV